MSSPLTRTIFCKTFFELTRLSWVQTFGEYSSRYRGWRGGRGPGRGGRSGGGYYGRNSGYAGRGGRGHNMSGQ